MSSLLTQYVYSHKSITGVQGFSRETLVALFANIESRQWRRAYSAKDGMLPEHPRASTTDDVEFFQCTS